jgi:RNA polymerase sigma factor (sigma-70 family)
MPASQNNADSHGPRVFATTHWSVVLAAQNGESEPKRRALESLCGSYWYPIYVYVRRKGYSPHDAQDLTQEFFAQLIAKGILLAVDRERGKFRSFLLATLDHVAAREWNRAHRLKRGTQYSFLSWEDEKPEDRYLQEPANVETPERDFDRQWAITVLSRTMEELRKECEANGKAALFAELKPRLAGDTELGSYSAISQRLGMSEAWLRVAIHRMRRRFGELLRNEVAQTVGSTEDVETELRYLMRVMSQ